MYVLCVVVLGKRCVGRYLLEKYMEVGNKYESSAVTIETKLLMC